jgi:hypothetical protein
MQRYKWHPDGMHENGNGEFMLGQDVVAEIERLEGEGDSVDLERLLIWAIPWAGDAVRKARLGAGHQDFKQEADEMLRKCEEWLVERNERQRDPRGEEKSE